MKRELSKNIKLPCWTSRLSSSSCIEVNNMLPENNWWPSQMIRRHHVHSFGKFSFQNSLRQFTVKICHPQLPKKSLSKMLINLLDFLHFSGIAAGRAGESWISFSDMKKRWFWWIFKCKKFNLFWHLPLYLRISQQLHWFSTIW